MQWDFEAIGTVWQITTDQKVPSAKIQRNIAARIAQFDGNYSRFRTDSLVWQMSECPGTYEMPDDLPLLIEFYRKLYNVSGGKVTPLIGTTMEQAGYGKDYSLSPIKLTAPPSWESAIEVRETKLLIKLPGVLLDFGAAGKGYLVDIVAGMLRDFGIHQFTINAGGDIWVEAGPTIIGLQDPHDNERVIGQVSLVNQAVAASSPNLRKWRDFHHIIDPVTLLPEPTVQATWVAAASCMLADGLATALSFVKPALLTERFAFEYAMIESGNLHMSKNFNAELFTDHG